MVCVYRGKFGLYSIIRSFVRSYLYVGGKGFTLIERGSWGKVSEDVEVFL